MEWKGKLDGGSLDLDQIESEIPIQCKLWNWLWKRTWERRGKSWSWKIRYRMGLGLDGDDGDYEEEAWGVCFWYQMDGSYLQGIYYPIKIAPAPKLPSRKLHYSHSTPLLSPSSARTFPLGSLSPNLAKKFESWAKLEKQHFVPLC